MPVNPENFVKLELAQGLCLYASVGRLYCKIP